ncbi:MAG TPA: adenylate/guanylate cyclase domain-containing protein [Gaiellaceae bacterium]|nr:adenylate/guanylate cyclase domain-containing protein [Gaiellaceae bacterium]
MQGRKTVSILFCDVVDSTPLGEQLDPESLQRVMSRWFAEARTIVELHGGTVEKFIGDEVMAVFGVPVVHEDDALRAVRSASAMRDRLTSLNDELEQAYGVRLAVRIGVNTGEVVVGDPSSGGTFVMGEPVNLAKRLEQAAAPGQILIGKATYPLVANAVRAGPLESFRVKGKREAVAPFRVEHVDTDAPGVARRRDTALVDRKAELARLEEAFEAAAAETTSRLVTLVGAAGLGKTRLADELVQHVADRARVLTGRCLPYGDGITFWPLIGVLHALGKDGLGAALAGADDRDAVAERLRALTSDAPGPVDELFWAARRLVESLAADRPLVLVLEDIHRAEPTFLDLVEYLHSRIDSAAVLIVCPARPELLERRPGWTAPRERADVVVLEPLAERDADALLAGLGADLDDATRERVLRSAEGNPLYVEQLAALAETGELVVPPTIQALLSERLDRLGDDERAVLERAAIVGQEFSRRAVTDLCPPELRSSVGRHLLALVRRELVRPHASGSTTEDGFRFRHALIRDVTYETMPKEARALFHEWFADWLDRNAGERATELEEIVGYHLEQAVRMRAELGPTDARSHRLARRGAQRLAASGRRAFGRDDLPAAVNLLARALALLAPDASERPALLATLASAQAKSGDFRLAEETFALGADEASRVGDRRSALRITVERQAMRFFTAPNQTSEENIRVAQAVIPELEALGDDLGLAKAWRLLSDAHATSCQWGAKEEALEQALRHARRAPEARQELSAIIGQLAQTLHYGPTPAPEAIGRCRELLAAAERDRGARAGVTASMAALRAARGEFDEARTLFADAVSLYEELGLRFRRTVRAFDGAEIELLAGDVPNAERQMREAYSTLEEMGENGVRCVAAAVLADILCRLGADAEAAAFAAVAEELAEEDDVFAQVVRRSVLARLLARQGRGDEAEALAREALGRIDQTDFLALQADARLALADVRASVGDDAGAQALREAARALFERKGNLAAARVLDLPLGSPRPAV